MTPHRTIGQAEALERRTLLAAVTFTVDQALSRIAISGDAAGMELEPQGPGSLSTSYRGTILADVTGSFITFTSGSAIAANNSGNWRPDASGNGDNSAPANYGAEVTQLIFFTTYAAVRDAVFDITSGALEINPANGQFSSAGETVVTTAGTIDYDVAIPAMSGSEPLAGNSGANDQAGPSSYTVSNRVARLVIPVQATLTLSLLGPDDSHLTLSGQIVATGPAPASTVANRQVFYNNSAFDANGDNDQAIAPDKTALLPGVTATFVNVTNYSKGLNGIMIDLQGAPGAAGISADDFTFRVGTGDNPAAYAPAPAPSSLAVRPGAGTGGSDRIEITWPNNAIQRTWLQVTMLANNDTNLAAPDVFYFGNLPGEVGNAAATPFFVNSLDVQQTRNNQFQTADLYNPFDHDRSGGIVGSIDVQIARINQFSTISVLTPPVAVVASAPALSVASTVVPAAMLSPAKHSSRSARLVEELQ